MGLRSCRLLEMVKLFMTWAYDEDKSWKEVFLSDLKELEEAGVTHKDVKRARKLLR